jgi:hypothetical protein
MPLVVAIKGSVVALLSMQAMQYRITVLIVNSNVHGNRAEQ